MRKSRGKERKVTRKNAREPRGEEKLTLSWPMEELLSEVNGQIEAFSAQVRMRIMHAVMEHEVGKILGEWGRQSAYRHGSQPGYNSIRGPQGEYRASPSQRQKRRGSRIGYLPGFPGR